MTAREIAEEAVINKKMLTDEISTETWIDSLEYRIEQHANPRALQIAGKAAAEVLEEYETVRQVSPVIFAGRIINRIKTEIGGK